MKQSQNLLIQQYIRKLLNDSILRIYSQQQIFNMDLLTGNIEGILKSILQQQLQYEKNGDYVGAEKCRVNYENQKQALHKKHLSDMNARHKQQQADLNGAWKQELDSFNQFWDDKMGQFSSQSKTMEQDLKKKHDQDLAHTRASLDQTLPIKVKESSELLNLRKMQQHMAKQKNYQQAHKIQTKANALFAKESEAWNISRKNKMDTALNTLRTKQNTQMKNFLKRVQTSKAEKNRDRKLEQDKINLKYENFMRDLKKNQEKEVLAFKGQFKSLGGSATASSSPNKTGSSMGSVKKSP